MRSSSRTKTNLFTDAKEILIAAGNPNEWEQIKEIILNSYGDRRDLTSHIQSLFYISQGKKTLTEFYNQIKKIDTSIKSTAALMDDYKSSTKAINSLISLMSLTRFVDGLNDELSMHIRSYRPQSLEDAYSITIQYSNAAYRQKLDRKPIPERKNFNTPMHKSTAPTNNYQKPQPVDKSSGSAKFKNFKQNLDEDVSMRTARSRNEINNHTTEKSNEIKEEPDTSLLDSEDDELLVDELNFQMASAPNETT